MRFWPTTWGELAPGDEIQAPDGTVWVVGSAITCDGRGEWEIGNVALDTHMWTEQPESGTVKARRPFAPPVPSHAVKETKAPLADMLDATHAERN